MRRSPSEGGCWFCHDDADPIDFSIGFDTYVHLDCIKAQLIHGNPEAIIMARELDLPLKERPNARDQETETTPICTTADYDPDQDR